MFANFNKNEKLEPGKHPGCALCAVPTCVLVRCTLRRMRVCLRVYLRVLRGMPTAQACGRCGWASCAGCLGVCCG